MCRDPQPDGSYRVSTGGTRPTRLRNQARVELLRYNYVVYEQLGSNLEEGFLSFLANVLGGSNHDFFYVEPDMPSNLRVLFNAQRDGDIPVSYRQYTSSLEGRWIYLYIDAGDGLPDELIEIDYRSGIDWDATTYRWESEGDIQPYQSNGGDGEFFRINRSRLPRTKGIALPDQVDPSTAVNILIDSSVQEFCLAMPVNIEGHSPGTDMQIIIFDPGHIVAHSAQVARYHARFMQIVDARVSHRRLSSFEERTRKKGILATLCKELVARDDSLENEINQRVLDANFNRYANYGHRKALFIDNIYNFLNHEILINLEENLMRFQDDNVPVDGRVWLQIIAPLAEIAGEHVLLASYFQESSDRQASEGAFANFYNGVLNRGTAQQSTITRVWGTSLQGLDFMKVAVGVAETRAYHLVNEYTAGNMNWRTFNDSLSSDSERLASLPPYIRRSGAIVTRLRSIRSTFTWANRLGRAGAVLKGDITTGSFTAALDTLSELADSRGAVAIAAKLSFVKNTIDVISNSADFLNRFGMEDYDAALGHGMAVAAGIAELGYIIATGTTMGGPVGAVITIVGSLGAIIVLLGTDSDRELFMESSIFGTHPHGSSANPGWSVCPFNQYTDTPDGVERQLNSLINLLHKIVEVRDRYDNITHVIAVEIDTEFLPDTALFKVMVELEAEGVRGTCRAILNLRFPRRSRNRYSRHTPRQSGATLIRGANVRVTTERAKHTIHLNFGVHERINAGKIWIVCYPFGHSEFSIPHGDRGIYLEDCAEPRTFFRSHDFEADEWRPLPSW